MTQNRPVYQQAPKRPKRSHPFLIAIGGVFLGGVLLIIGIAVIVGVAANHSSKPGGGTSKHPAAADLTGSGCAVDSLGIPQATITVVNHSSGTSDYTYQVDWMNPVKTVVAQGYGAVDNVAPNQTVVDHVVGDNQTSGPLTCSIANVTRYASS